MSKPAFAWVTDPDAPPNLYLKWPNTSRIGSGIHDAASWAEAFEAKERRWLLFREVPFQASNGAGFTIRLHVPRVGGLAGPHRAGTGGRLDSALPQHGSRYALKRLHHMIP